ncbi:DNA polymerase III subunit beta family protein [Nocardia asteroides]|uniref:DNA polymerase III subunit beta family protein n=1 Tax=Nocardia asteroides TaxID=1824 RepID=UPI0036607B77
MSDSELLTIGAFARACGLSASALRFYADAGVLVPAVVDATTGYRYYAPGQATTARLVRSLRAVDMPLPAVVTVLAEPDPARRASLVDDHLHALDDHLDAIRSAADAARTAMRSGTTPAVLSATGTAPETDSPSGDRDHAPAAEPNTAARRDECVVRVRGPLLAAAIDQIAAATVLDPDLPVLNSIHLEARGEDLVLTATDRYRLATRTLRTTPAAAKTPTTKFDPATAGQTATLAAEDLRAADIAATVAADDSLGTATVGQAATLTSGDLRAADISAMFAAEGSSAADGSGAVGQAATFAPDGLRAADIAATASAADWGAAVPDWSATVDADDLRTAASWLRRTHTVCLRPGATHLELGADAAREDRRRCRISAEEFPDYRAMLAALPPVTTRVVLNRAAVLAALEECAAPTITLVVDPAGVRLGVAPMGATAAGPPITIHFAVITLYPAVAGAVGPDVMVDLLAPDLPARIRSADDGDLLTLAMPCRPDHPEETSR